MASIAANFRSTCDSARGAPESSTQHLPAAALQVGQETDNTCLGVSSLFFMLAGYAYAQSRIRSILASGRPSSHKRQYPVNVQYLTNQELACHSHNRLLVVIYEY